MKIGDQVTRKKDGLIFTIIRLDNMIGLTYCARHSYTETYQGITFELFEQLFNVQDEEWEDITDELNL